MAKIVALILGFLLAAGAGAGTWWYQKHTETVASLEGQIRESADTRTKDAVAHAEEKKQLEQTIADLTANIESLTSDRDSLKQQLADEKDQVDTMQKTVSTAMKTVNTLDKLAKTDAELLQKYSKVYFLNEHYAPAKLSKLDEAYVYNAKDEEYLQTAVMPFFEDMVKDALDDGVKLYVVSAYRSFEQQRSLKRTYAVTYGSGANAFSADQGYSEHQLGTTIDFTTTGINGGLTGFEATAAYDWLTKNAYRYGFVLSYPKDNEYYIFEPWHWRFVGTDLARTLHRENEFFYDMDQRTIDTYLVSIFD